MADEQPPPLGFRFYPTEEELASFFLRNQLDGQNQDDMHRVIPVLDIYEKEPWDLPQLAGDRCQEDTEQWFFFVPRQKSEARGGRLNRGTPLGYWKATGSPGYVYSSDHRVIAVKKSMVFYLGKAPTGRKTKWKMNEYKAIDRIPPHHPSHSQAAHRVRAHLRHEFTVCRVYVASGACRAFDRRPVEATPGETPAAVPNASEGEEGEHVQNPESSRQGDPPSGFEEFRWDWEQLEWP
ncbi:hypothetical protein CDL15_Pgr025201 [Punica granatum]|uniref:NAC domain-containing protein n=1 Tax=Punica granatum TaxID=22663 RepID=A0A218W813_PUNGR|nr:hypothetical protein CDL15_Pgr025201 [Punica granatum]